MEERASAVSKADEGAADLKKKVAELSESLEKYEKEHQVNTASSYFFLHWLHLHCYLVFICMDIKLFAVITMVRVY